MGSKKELVILFISLVVLIVFVAYLAPYKTITLLYSPIEDDAALSDGYNTYFLGDEVYSKVSVQDELSWLDISIPNKGEFEVLLRQSVDGEAISLQIDSEIFVVPEKSSKKFDFDEDDRYDAILYFEGVSDDGAQVSMEIIDESVGLFDPTSSKVEALLKRQSQIFSVIIFLLLVLIFVRIFFDYLLPVIRTKRLKKQRDPIAVLREMMEKIDHMIVLEKKESLIKRLRHFYDYLSDDEKKRALRLRGMERYIN